MKPYAESFYKSKAWQNCRDAFIRSKGGLCEKCLKDGRYTPAEIVHHKIHITPENINDPEVVLNFENLEALCREHHAEEHTGKIKRFKVDEMGRVTIL